MIASKVIPEKYLKWNNTWKAPFGRQIIFKLLKKIHIFELLPKHLKAITKGYFGFQTNNSTRIFEYPWVADNISHKPGALIVDIGGGYGGFQFVLSKQGYHVINVDPGDKSHYWDYGVKSFDSLNKAFGTKVKLEQKYLHEVGIKSKSIDVVICISVIEHLPHKQRVELLKEIHKILKTGGKLILTVDLFLDINPFTPSKTNMWGKNVNIRKLIQESGMKLIYGNTNELFGFSEFKSEKILENLSSYLIGVGYPALAQCIILEKSK